MKHALLVICLMGCGGSSDPPLQSIDDPQSITRPSLILPVQDAGTAACPPPNYQVEDCQNEHRICTNSCALLLSDGNKAVCFNQCWAFYYQCLTTLYQPCTDCADQSLADQYRCAQTCFLTHQYATLPACFQIDTCGGDQ
jgi:hypothetical protein